MALKWFPDAQLICPHCHKLVLLVQRRELRMTKQDKQAARKRKKEVGE